MVPKSHDDNIRWPQNGQIMSARAGMERKKLAAAECEIGSLQPRKYQNSYLSLPMKIPSSTSKFNPFFCLF